MTIEIDISKGVWRVIGRLPEPDGRRITVMVNADSLEQASMQGIAQGMAEVESATFYTPEQIAEMEKLVQPMTTEEIEHIRKVCVERSVLRSKQ